MRQKEFLLYCFVLSLTCVVMRIHEYQIRNVWFATPKIYHLSSCQGETLTADCPGLFTRGLLYLKKRYLRP